MSPFQLANTLEAVLWWVLAALLLFAARTRPAWPRRTLWLAVGTLVAFGISDLVETRTGAWYHPWWLLVWKSACVVLLIYCAAELYRARRKERA
jgi:hypothetical protein